MFSSAEGSHLWCFIISSKVVVSKILITTSKFSLSYWKTSRKCLFLSYMVTDALAIKHDVIGYIITARHQHSYMHYWTLTNIILHYHDWQVPQWPQLLTYLACIIDLLCHTIVNYCPTLQTLQHLVCHPHPPYLRLPPLWSFRPSGRRTLTSGSRR